MLIIKLKMILLDRLFILYSVKMEKCNLETFRYNFVYYKLVIKEFTITNFGVHIPYELIDNIMLILAQQILNVKLKDIDVYVKRTCYDKFEFNGHIWFDIQNNCMYKSLGFEMVSIIIDYVIYKTTTDMNNININDLSIDKVISLYNDKLVCDKLLLYCNSDVNKYLLNGMCKILLEKK